MKKDRYNKYRNRIIPILLMLVLVLSASSAYGESGADGSVSQGLPDSSESEVTLMFTGDLMCQPVSRQLHLMAKPTISSLLLNM